MAGVLSGGICRNGLETADFADRRVLAGVLVKRGVLVRSGISSYWRGSCGVAGVSELIVAAGSGLRVLD